MYTMITIYQTDDISEVKGLGEAVAELNTISKVKIESEHIPAVSDYFGKAINLILSEPVETILTIYALGEMINKIIKLVKKAEKKITLSKGAVRLLALSKLRESDPMVEQIDDIENPVVWGPMLIETFGGELKDIKSSIEYDSACGEKAYLIVIAVKKNPNRVRTIWQIIGTDGILLLSWTTQTLADRVPEFLRPH